MDRWTKKRAQDELKDPENWEITYQGQFFREKQFEFYSLRLVKCEALLATSDWENRTDISHIPLIGDWNDSRRLYVRTILDDGQYALSEISKPTAVDLMLEAAEIEMNPHK